MTDPLAFEEHRHLLALRLREAVERLLSRADAGTVEAALAVDDSLASLGLVLTRGAQTGRATTGDESDRDGRMWAVEERRGAAAKVEIARLAGPVLSPADTAQALDLASAAEVEARIADGRLLAVHSDHGLEVPFRQINPVRRDVRAGLPAVLEAFEGEDPWVILSILVGPDPLTGRDMVLDLLDDPDCTAAMIELAGTYGQQGAA